MCRQSSVKVSLSYYPRAPSNTIFTSSSLFPQMRSRSYSRHTLFDADEEDNVSEVRLRKTKMEMERRVSVMERRVSVMEREGRCDGEGGSLFGIDPSPVFFLDHGYVSNLAEILHHCNNEAY